MTYDAILLVSFGGPEGPADVIPFLENVLRGRNVPRERMLEVAKHYQRFGGVSPINAQNRALIVALEKELAQHGMQLPVYFGNRNWHPLLANTLEQMKADGIRRAAAFVTSAFSCYSGCRQYRENIEDAQRCVGSEAPVVDKLRVYYDHPGFIHPMVDNVSAALRAWEPEVRETVAIAYTAHSIPQGMSDNSNYVSQLQESCRLVAEAVGKNPGQLVYQSRSGSPRQPWLEPDICDHIRQLHARGVSDLVIVPIGFISDHMEVMFDLDTEARSLCESLGMRVRRAATVGTDRRFVSMIRQLVEERMRGTTDRVCLGAYGPNPDVCPEDCCLPGIGRPSTAT